MDTYTIPQAADALGVSRVTLWRWVEAGKVKAVKQTARLWLVPGGEVERLLRIEAQQLEAGSPTRGRPRAAQTGGAEQPTSHTSTPPGIR